MLRRGELFDHNHKLVAAKAGQHIGRANAELSRLATSHKRPSPAVSSSVIDVFEAIERSRKITATFDCKNARARNSGVAAIDVDWQPG